MKTPRSILIACAAFVLAGAFSVASAQPKPIALPGGPAVGNGASTQPHMLGIVDASGIDRGQINCEVYSVSLVRSVNEQVDCKWDYCGPVLYPLSPRDFRTQAALDAECKRVASEACQQCKKTHNQMSNQSTPKTLVRP